MELPLKIINKGKAILRVLLYLIIVIYIYNLGCYYKANYFFNNSNIKLLFP